MHRALPWRCGLTAAGVSILAAPGAVMLFPVARDVHFSPALAWLLAALNLAVIVVAIVMFVVSARRRPAPEWAAASHERASVDGQTEGSLVSAEGEERVVAVSQDTTDSDASLDAKRAEAKLREAEAREAEAREAILAMLGDPDPFRRVEAIAALRGRSGSERLLLRALHDEYPLVRREVVRVLRTVGGAAATETLIQVAGHDPSAEVREEAVAALGAIVREREKAQESPSG